MTYSAKSIASTLVKLSTEHKLWISNLKLQKLLYFSWIDYYREHDGAHLFDDEIQAWRYGPVVPSVYYEYWCNAANTLFVPKRSPEVVDDETQEFLLNMLRKYNDKSVGYMIELSHKTKPWIDNYEVRAKNTIPMKDMEEEALHSSI